MSTWRRRAISVGGLICGNVVTVVLLPLAGMVFLIIDAFRDRRFPLIRAYLLLTFYCVWELFGVMASFIVWCLSGIWMGRNRTLFLTWNYMLQRIWTKGFAFVGLGLFSLRLNVEEGGYRFSGQPVILLIRHVSLADTILAAYLVSVRYGVRLRYAMKRELLWDPCLDIVGNRLPNYFVDRSSVDARREAEAIGALAENLETGEGVIIWPEATRFSDKKRAQALARLRADGEDEVFRLASGLRFVLPPRQAGVSALLERNGTADVVFCAHTGFESASSFREFFNGSLLGRRIAVTFWGVPASAVPRERLPQKRWLFENWKRIDDFVANDLQ